MAKISDQTYEGPDKLWLELEKDYNLSARGGSRRLTGDDLDRKVEHYRPFFAYWKSSKVTNEELSNEFKTIYAAFSHYRDDSPASFKWIIEALMMIKGNNNKQIAEDIGPPMRPGIIKAYRELYFDVKDKLDFSPWRNRYIWAPTEGEKNEEMFFAKHVYKKLALRGGKNALMEVISGDELSDEVAELLYNIREDDERVTSLKTPAVRAKLDAMGKAMQNANNVNRISRERAIKKSGGSGIPSIPAEIMQSLGSAVGGHMKVIGIDVELQSKEVVVTDMYTEEDLKKDNKNG